MNSFFLLSLLYLLSTVAFAIEESQRFSKRTATKTINGKKVKPTHTVFKGVTYTLLTTDDKTAFRTEDFETAKKSCQKAGGTIVTIVSKELDEHLTQWLSQDMKVEESIWLSLTRDQSTQEFVWPKGRKATQGFSNWNDGEPNDGNTEHTEDCVELYVKPNEWVTPGKWNDIACDLERKVLCQRKTKRIKIKVTGPVIGGKIKSSL